MVRQITNENDDVQPEPRRLEAVPAEADMTRRPVSNETTLVELINNYTDAECAAYAFSHFDGRVASAITLLVNSARSSMGRTIGDLAERIGELEL